MAAEEFQESEVIFRENAVHKEDVDDEVSSGFSGHSNPRIPTNNNSNKQQLKKRRKKKKKKKENSVPVNIPENVSGNSWLPCRVDTDFFDEDDEEELVPPHVMVGRRIFDGKMAFSVCTGNGRTLKGRDLSEVRNSILRKTGFLET